MPHDPATHLAQRLTQAFPDVFHIDAEAGTLDLLPDWGTARSWWELNDLEDASDALYQEEIWLEVSAPLIRELNARGLRWSLGSGNERGAHCATCDRALRERQETSTAVVFDDNPGRALAHAACLAVLGTQAMKVPLRRATPEKAEPWTARAPA